VSAAYLLVELTPCWLEDGLAGSFPRVQVLVNEYGGDPRRWLEAIECGRADAEEADLAFLDTMQQRLLADPTLLRDLTPAL
jgi:hypothetical protein